MPSRPMHHAYAPARRFPNTDTLAYFIPNSQTIYLNEIEDGDIEAWRTSLDHRNLRIAMGTVYHEITHWADLVGTVWGRNHLRAIYGCLRLLEHTMTPGRECEFHAFVDLHDEERRLMLPEYYTTLGDDVAPHDHTRPWGIQFSAGREYDSSGRLDDTRPILFVKFLDAGTGKLVIRQPLTVGALLEANAVWSEMRTVREVLGTIPAADRAAEESHWNAGLLEELYDVELTLYTAPAHLLAHYAGTTNLALASEMASAVANIALNLCPHHFAALKPPAVFEPWEELFQAFLDRENRAFAYAAICAGAGRSHTGQSVNQWLETGLAAIGLPERDALLAEARIEAARHEPDADVSKLGLAEGKLFLVGLEMFDHRSSDTAITPARAEAMELPLLFDKAGVLIAATPKTIDERLFDPVFMHDAQERLETWTVNFLGSCR